MTFIYVDWGPRGGRKLKLTWMQDLMPERELITSTHAFCFHEGKLLMVNCVSGSYGCGNREMKI